MERPDLADELGRMASTDLALRQRLADTGELFGGYHPEMRAVHRRNGDRLSEILDQLGGWPGFGLVGVDGSEAAFLIAQHDIANPPLLRRAFDLYETAVAAGEAEPRRLAHLEDRICYFEGRAQRYGTQLGWDSNGRFGPWPPVEDPGSVDRRRAVLGLSTLAQALADAAADRPATRPSAEVMAEHDAADNFARQVGWRPSSDGPRIRDDAGM